VPLWAPYFLDHCASGILTVSISYVFRTPPGYGMLVRGLVETDWIESTFPMNWKITEPHRKAAFKKGDPLVFLQPYPLPKVRPLASDIALMGPAPAPASPISG
jgi:hypothetical protein